MKKQLLVTNPQPITPNSSPVTQPPPIVHDPLHFSRRDYVEASWCYIHAHHTLKALQNIDGARTALSDLDRYFGKVKDAGKLYTRLCEKAVLLSVVASAYRMTAGDIWQCLVSRKTGFECAKISGQKIRKLKRDNPDILFPVHITSKYLLQMLKRVSDGITKSSDDLVNQCGNELVGVDAAHWMNLFFDALRWRPQFEY